jgi:hexosaminidase
MLGFQAMASGAEEAGRSIPMIIPQPAQMELAPGEFSMTAATAIVVEPGPAGVRGVGDYLAVCLRQATGLDLAVRDAAGGETPVNAILLTTAGAPAELGDEGYELVVKPEGVLLRAPRPAGLARGVQTLRQLLPPDCEKTGGRATGAAAGRVPCLRISDRPRYRWRGLLLDCGRHFMTKEFVKRYIDLLAYHKLNVLHWHLTEDQGWRIEIKKYPKLTEVGAWRGEGAERYGGFYTQEDVKEIVAYAQSRYVTVVPEIELPGHSRAALASYPELSCTGGPFTVATNWGVFEDVYCAGNEQTFAFLEDVLTEVMALFPSEYVHIGGDECPKARWKACPKCQARIQAEGLRNEDELQSYFIRRVEKFLNAKGRRLIGWDEILEGGVAPNATVQSWRSMKGAVAAAQSGHDFIASPVSHCYVDYPQTPNPAVPDMPGIITLEKTYSFEPTPPELTEAEGRHVLGAEVNIWTEGAPQERVDHQVFPRLCALAEVTWSPAKQRNWDDFSGRMNTHYRRLDALGVTYYVPPPRLKTAEMVFTETADVAFTEPFGGGEIRFTRDGSNPGPTSERYGAPVRLTDTTQVKARTFMPSGNVSDTAEFRFEKQAPREPVKVAEVVPGVTYAYYEGSWDRLPDFDQLTPVATGNAAGFDLAVRKREDEFALRFSGLIEVPTDGAYTFYLYSDDGSRLLIGSDVIVSHGGSYPPSEQRGQIMLKAGKHPITVLFFEARGAQVLEVGYAGPGVARQPIPAAALWRPTSAQ